MDSPHTPNSETHTKHPRIPSLLDSFHNPEPYTLSNSKIPRKTVTYSPSSKSESLIMPSIDFIDLPQELSSFSHKSTIKSQRDYLKVVILFSTLVLVFECLFLIEDLVEGDLPKILDVSAFTVAEIAIISFYLYIYHEIDHLSRRKREMTIKLLCIVFLRVLMFFFEVFYLVWECVFEDLLSHKEKHVVNGITSQMLIVVFFLVYMAIEFVLLWLVW